MFYRHIIYILYDMKTANTHHVTYSIIVLILLYTTHIYSIYTYIGQIISFSPGGLSPAGLSPCLPAPPLSDDPWPWRRSDEGDEEDIEEPGLGARGEALKTKGLYNFDLCNLTTQNIQNIWIVSVFLIAISW